MRTETEKEDIFEYAKSKNNSKLIFTPGSKDESGEE